MATDQDLLDQANAARHKLLTGTSAVEVDMGTYRARFTPANREALESYIAELSARISGCAPRRGAVGIVF
ncbi:MAG: hypothetical protein GC182_08595 [Rhodopseudomonas sp.]|nr:hypothetical protein [Rhodopseudomonas sp.]